ncbi:MAG: signal peptide prediction [Janthinobacterium lividum]
MHEQRNRAYYTTPRVWLPRLWNSGNSLLGLLCSLGGRPVWHKADGIIEVSGGWLIGLLSRAGWASAITLGEVVLYAGSHLMPVLHDHEMVHVYQGRVWGPFFLPAYVLESAYQWLRTGNGYYNNRFEVAAYSADAVRDKGR